MRHGWLDACGVTQSVGVGLLLAGCEVVEGAQNAGTDLLDPDPTYVAGPGRRVTTERHSRLGLAFSEVGGQKAISLRHHDGGTELCITSLATGDRCIAGPAADYRLHQRGQAPERGLISFREPAHDGQPHALRFTNHACEQVGERIENAAFPPRDFEQGTGYLVQQGTSLLYVDPYVGPSRVLGTQVTTFNEGTSGMRLIDAEQFVALDANLNEQIRLGSQVTNFGAIGVGTDSYLAIADGPELLVFDADYNELLRLHSQFGRWHATSEHIWLIDGGELVVFDAEFTELLRLGSQVSEFRVTGLERDDPSFPGQPAFYVDGYVDSGLNLYRLDDFEVPAELVAEDVCRIQLAPSVRGVLSYLSPCAAGRLVLHDLETDEQYLYAEGVTDIVATRSLDEGGYRVLYLTGSLGEQTFWLQAPGESPTQVAQYAEIGRAVPQCAQSDSVNVWAGCNQDTCDLIEWGGGPEIRVLAQGVSRTSSDAILANFDGRLGELMLWTPLPGEAELPPQERTGCALTAYATGVPVHRLVRDNDEDSPHASNAAAFIMDYDGHAGTLALTEPNFSQSQLYPLPLAEPERIARNVPLGGYDFLNTYPGLAYLSAWDPETATGTLRATNLDLGAVSRVNTGVQGFIEWPDAGLVYTIPRGEDAGLWIAPFK